MGSNTMRGWVLPSPAWAITAIVTAVTLAIGGSLVPVPGGVLFRDSNGNVLGAVGVSGDTSDKDEAVAVAGIEALHLTAQPA